MKKFTVIKNENCKIIPLADQKNHFTLIDFFAPYGTLTNEVFMQFLDVLYGNYKKTQHYHALPFGEKAEADFNYFLLRKFLEGLKR